MVAIAHYFGSIAALAVVYADVFHCSIARAQWEHGITGSGLSPWWGEPGNFGYVSSGSDFASFGRLLDQLDNGQQVDNGQTVVAVNYGSALEPEGDDAIYALALARLRLEFRDSQLE